MAFWITLIWYVGLYVVGELLRPRAKPENRGPSSLSDFNIPTAAEGAPIPVMWGTCHLRSPNVVWYGDLDTIAIKHKYRTSLFSTTEEIQGYQYWLGVDLVLCHGPIDDVQEVRFEDRAILAQGAPGSGMNHFIPTLGLGPFVRMYVDAWALFGGINNSGGQGGVLGTIDVFLGTTFQLASDYLVAVIGTPLPGHRGICHAVLRRVYLGTTPYLKPISFVIRRVPNTLGLTGGHHSINSGSDANPACMLYEILTDVRWGCGIAPGQIDTASFLAAGDTLFTEGFGLSMVLDSQTDASSIVQEILRHVDGVIFADPLSGLLTLKLARADYVPGTLPVLDESNVEEVTLSRKGWSETKNVVKVRYIDRAANYLERIAQAMDLANVQVRGEYAAAEYDFHGISTAALAQRIAARTLITESYPWASLTLKVNRKAWKLTPGAVARLTWAPLGIVDMAVRITRPRVGELGDGWIQLEAVEDVFAVAWTGYAAPGGTGWANPVAAPAALLTTRLVEAPYGLAGGDHRRVITLGVRGAGAASGYQVWSDVLGGTAYAQTNDVPALTPSATLLAAITPKVTTINLVAGPSIQGLESVSAADLAAGMNVLLVDDEWIAWQTITLNGDGTYTLTGCVRGVLDSTPKAHSSGARVYFVTEGSGLSALADYLADLTLTAKLLTYNTQGVLAIGSAAQITVTTQSRTARPYVPTAIKENAVSYPLNIADALAVSWSHRNRLGVWEYDDAGVTAGLEAGTAYRVKVYGETGTLIHTESAIAGTSWTYPLATEISESGGLGRPNGVLRVTVEAYQTGGAALISQQLYDWTTDAAGWGMLHGTWWGGTPG